MRHVATILAASVLSLVVQGLRPATVSAQETIVIEGDAAAAMPGADAMPDAGGACGCRPQMDPPWHGSVAGDPCGPSCPPPNLFHANPCHQLHLKHTARAHGHVLPPCFPRMHTRLAEGHWPTPRPITLPRCPRCGAHIEGGW